MVLVFKFINNGRSKVIKNEDLEELRELGSGTFGTVYHGKWRGTDVAIKRIKKSCFIGRSSEQDRLVNATILLFLFLIIKSILEKILPNQQILL